MFLLPMFLFMFLSQILFLLPMFLSQILFLLLLLLLSQNLFLML